MATPNPNFFASVPLQYVFRDKDTGEPLSAGVVRFYSDPEFTVPKSVYQLTLLPDNTIRFDDIGNTLILSSIGTFVDDSGNNLVPYYYPWTNDPSKANPGEPQLYFVKVYSSGGVLQFTLSEWPPNTGAGSASTSGQVLSFNQITNPQFTVVNFLANPTTGIYTYTTSGTMSVDIAPGWSIVTEGIGTISLKQLSISDNILSEPPYGLQIQSARTTDLSSVKLVQRITNSPRILGRPENDGLASIAGYLVASSTAGTTIPITMEYIPSDTSAAQATLFSDETLSTGTYKEMLGAATISTPMSTANGSGYVDIVIDIGINSTVNISSVQLVQVASTSVTPGFIQQSTQDQLNSMMWYYKPQLAYKPIPSYTIGWDFEFNPCQQLGPSVVLSGLGNNLSRYIADQTIVFEAVGNVTTYSFNDGGFHAAPTTTTQLALIQYLPTDQAYELIHAPNLSVQIKGGIGAKGYVSLYYTTGSASGLTTTLTADGTSYTSGNSLVTALNDGIPTVDPSWTIIENPLASKVSSFANHAPFAAFDGLATNDTIQSLTGWISPVTNLDITPTYFAIVVSFESVPTTNTGNIPYITLNAGNIPTPPAPMSKAQTLQALQYYYQKSFKPGVVPAYAVGLSNGEEVFVQTGTGGGAGDTIMPIDFYPPLIHSPSVIFYNPVNINGSCYNQSTLLDMGLTQAAYVDARKCICTVATGGAGSVGNIMMVNWTADARLGTF